MFLKEQGKNKTTGILNACTYLHRKDPPPNYCQGIYLFKEEELYQMKTGLCTTGHSPGPISSHGIKYVIDLHHMKHATGIGIMTTPLFHSGIWDLSFSY